MRLICQIFVNIIQRVWKEKYDKKESLGGGSTGSGGGVGGFSHRGGGGNDGGDGVWGD